jgi:primosomal protein N' (replication factor Y)
VDRTFVYRVPPELAPEIQPGSWVEVEVRGRRLQGVVVGVAARAPRAQLRPIRALLDPAGRPGLPPDLLRFTRWLADYYAAPWGSVLRSALPAAVTPTRRKRKSVDGAEALAAGPLPRPAPAPAPAPQPTAEQAAAIHCITARLTTGEFHVLLLHGVTASGKTEVYVRAAEAALALDGTALVLVSEIGLSIQLLDRFQARLGARVAILHSGLTDAERRREWERIRAGEATVVVGARSAIFAPLERLRLIVVDEEHEASYKQDEVPRYHARDAAVMRGRLSSAVVVLGSATPSLESAYNAARGRYERIELRSRVDGRVLPEVVLADQRREGPPGAPQMATRPVSPATPTPPVALPPAPQNPPAPTGARAIPSTPPTISPLLRAALDETLTRGEQAILLVHRRGHSSFLQCTDCGSVERCPHCAVALTYHSAGFLLRCHHCGLRRPAPTRCPSCDGTRFWYGGIGTQRVEHEVAREFPAARRLRMDLDSTRGRGSHRAMIEAFAERAADVLIGTQMVAKGLDFPGVSLVGVVSADTLLNLPDFRAGERAFQLLTQVAGRAGRGEVGGRVIVQTYLPDHPSVQAAAQHDYATFYAAAIAEREELGYPPCGAMARIHVDGPDEARVGEVADRLGAGLQPAGDLTVLGPAPLPLRRLRGRERWHLTLLGPARTRVHAEAKRIARRGAASLPHGVRIQLDLDPVHLL